MCASLSKMRLETQEEGDDCLKCSMVTCLRLGFVAVKKQSSHSDCYQTSGHRNHHLNTQSTRADPNRMIKLS